jgi:hypothetical protein
MEMTMNKTRCLFQVLALSALAAGALGTANAAIFIRSRVIVAPLVAPVAVAPVAVAPVAIAPVVAAPVVVIPTCRFVSVPVVNAFTGVTYMVTRRVCN